jgi:invasion protein IalB
MREVRPVLLRSKALSHLVLACVLATGVLGAGGADAQQRRPTTHSVASEPKAAAQPAAGEATKPAGTWLSRCVSDSRDAKPVCVMEQNAFITKTGQLVSAVTVRFSPGVTEPVLMVQVPVGLYVPAGISLQVDSDKARVLPIQTCDLKGCFGAEPLKAEELGRLKSGKHLTVAFQNLGRQTINIPFVLEGFDESYKKIQ